jgi:trehalose-6-phosphate synthase
MPRGERRRRNDALTSYVRGHDVSRWAHDQLADLDRLCGVPVAE